MKMVGLRLGGNPIIDYASDFWLVSVEGGDAVGYITSPWWSPELDTNIALAWVPVAHSEVGTPLCVHLPEPYALVEGEPVEAEVGALPFRPSVNPSAREVATKKGLERMGLPVREVEGARGVFGVVGWGFDGGRGVALADSLPHHFC